MRQVLYEGKAKIIYKTKNPDEVIQYFKDDATAFDGKKRGSIREKGVLNCKISARIFDYLHGRGVKTHFVRTLSDREMLVKRVNIIPVEIVVRNIAAGSLAGRMGIEEGTPLKDTIVETYYKNDELGDPMINEDHIRVFGIASHDEIDLMKKNALEINSALVPFFGSVNITLVDYKLEFGRRDGKLFLADEISPDGCRLWDIDSGERLDKDRFRRDLGKIEDAYRDVCERVLGATEKN